MVDHTFVQLAGGDAENQNAYLGLDRELTVDTSNKELRLHDGATPGGISIPNKPQNDARYQKKSPELDALTGFKPSAIGFLVRTGAASYTIRSITVDTNQLSLTHGSGSGGNPELGLADEIKSNHTASGDWVFTKKITGSAGFEGDVVGNLTGNTTGKHTGDVDVSDSTITFDEEQIPQAAVAGLVEALANLSAAIQPGAGIFWFGALDNIPVGWYICDGSHGTPDLRAKFIVASGADAWAPGAVGGTLTHSHTVTNAAGGAHTHVVNVGDTSLTLAQIPTHTHQVASSAAAINDDVGVSDTVARYQEVAGGDTQYRFKKTADAPGTANVGVSSDEGGGGAHSHAGNSESAGSHTHAATVGTGSSIPPYYAAVIIMKGF